MDKLSVSSQIQLARLPWATLLLFVVITTLYFFYPPGSSGFSNLVLNKSDGLNPAKMISGQLIHTELAHLSWNLAALLFLGLIVESKSRLLFLASMLSGAISIAIWFLLENQFERYAGLSGVLNALFVVALYCLSGPGTRLSKYNLMLAVAFVLYLAKNIFELVTGAAVLSNLVWQITPGAHISGMAAGVFCVGIYRVRRAKLDQPFNSKRR